MDFTGHQCVFTGSLHARFEHELAQLAERKSLTRLWARDLTLWPAEPVDSKRIREGLAFLHQPERVASTLAWVDDALRTAQERGTSSIVLVGLEGAQSIARALLGLSAPDRFGCEVFQSGHPGEVAALDSRVDLTRSLFLCVNRGHYDIENWSLLMMHHSKLSSGGADPVNHFLALSRPNNHLASIATEYRFPVFQEPDSGITPTHGLLADAAVLLAGVFGIPLEVLRVACREAHESQAPCNHNGPGPAVELAAFLATAAVSGRTFLALAAPPELEPFAESLCPLVGESLGQGDTPLLPYVVGQDFSVGEAGDRNAYALIRNAARENDALSPVVESLRSHGIPHMEMKVSGPLDLLRLTFHWQIATALASAQLRLNPFIPLDQRPIRALTAPLLNDYSKTNDTLYRKPRLTAQGVQLFAEADTRQEISQLNLPEALDSFFHLKHRVSYVSLFYFLEPKPEIARRFARIRRLLAETLSMPVLLAFGPRAADIFPHLFRADGPPGLHLVITANSAADLPIPGASYSAAQLYQALALAKFEFLSEVPDFAIRLHLESEEPAALDRLEQLLGRVRVHP